MTNPQDAPAKPEETFRTRAEKRFKPGETWWTLTLRLGINPATMYRYKAGRIPPADVAIKIAKGLRTTVERLWGK